uniref:P-loop NTPase fold protein n=1 Tax=Rheinheimera sp. TaxID=1869214 RepID=UPI0027B8F304
MNKHISDNIMHYLSLDMPEYALLISGEWGSGKTHFIDDFIKKYSFENEKSNTGISLEKKFVKVSLFGMKKTESIDERIFQCLHPILGSKYAKITGGILKSAFKIGIDLDWNGDSKKDGTVNTDFKEFKLSDFFSEKSTRNKEIIFVFDDVERTQIDPQEVLGYINQLVEESFFKVILIANEKKLIENDKDKIYSEFKEKVIGKTFEIRNKFSEILDCFLEKNPIDSINFDKNIIIDVYERAGYNNLRHIKQSIIDCKQLLNKVNPEFLGNINFTSNFLYVFFMLSIESKHGLLKESEIENHNQLLKSLQGNKDKHSVSDDIFKKYNLEYGFILKKQTWVRIIYKSDIDEITLNKEIGGLSLFIRENEKERPSWMKLWYYWEYEDSHFSEALMDVIENFKNNKYEEPTTLLHVSALLIYFHKEGISSFSTRKIALHIKNNIDLISHSAPWKDKRIEIDLDFNGTGLGYMRHTDEDFRKIFGLIREKNTTLHQLEQKEREKETFITFLQEMENENIEYINNSLTRDKRWEPIFSKFNPESFHTKLTSRSNKFLHELHRALNYRYSKDMFMEGRVSYKYFIEEIDFWINLGSLLEKSESKNLKGLMLRNFKK